MGDEEEESSKQDHEATHSNSSIPVNAYTITKENIDTSTHANGTSSICTIKNLNL